MPPKRVSQASNVRGSEFVAGKQGTKRAGESLFPNDDQDLNGIADRLRVLQRNAKIRRTNHDLSDVDFPEEEIASASSSLLEDEVTSVQLWQEKFAEEKAKREQKFKQHVQEFSAKVKAKEEEVLTALEEEYEKVKETREKYQKFLSSVGKGVAKVTADDIEATWSGVREKNRRVMGLVKQLQTEVKDCVRNDEVLRKVLSGWESGAGEVKAEIEKMSEIKKAELEEKLELGKKTDQRIAKKVKSLLKGVGEEEDYE